MSHFAGGGVGGTGTGTDREHSSRKKPSIPRIHCAPRGRNFVQRGPVRPSLRDGVVCLPPIPGFHPGLLSVLPTGENGCGGAGGALSEVSSAAADEAWAIRLGTMLRDELS